MSTASSALDAYLDRYVARLTRRMEALDRLSARYAQGRLVLFIAGVVAVYQAWGTGATGWVLLAFAAVFAVVAFFHRRVDASIERHRLWRAIQEEHRARRRLDWDALPPPPAEQAAETHPFATDLQLFGPRSLHTLLDATRSGGGSARLADWLAAPRPDPAATQARQAAVRELVPRSLFRNRLLLLTALTTRRGTRWDGRALQAWLEAHAATGSLRTFVRLLSGLALLNIVLVIAHVAGWLPPLWPLSFFVYFALFVYKFGDFRHLFDEAEHLTHALEPFRAVLDYLETVPVREGSRLEALCAPFRQGDDRPSRQLRSIARIAAAASSQKSEILWLILNGLGPWDFFFAERLNQAKAQLRERLPAWLDAWHELEALCALSTFADLHPHYTFPTLHERPAASDGAPVLEAEALGHPLIPEAEKVRNDYRVPALGTVDLVTGSNMSGKSTFLRTVGVNLVLAQAGAPVDARAWHARPMRLFTCLQVHDSLGDGLSFFYAEVRRLKALLDALRADDAFPLFFAIDEIFRGTNNRERFMGSRAYVKALADGHGAGLVSTHDLDLVQLEEEAQGLRNFHFRETVEDGTMVFDYRLRRGPCPTTNALRIMRMEGLPVPTPDEAPEETHASSS